MSEPYDFEQAWLAKFSRCLDEIAGVEVRQEVMRGSEGLSSQTSRADVIAWSREAMERLDALVDEEQGKRIMTGCACKYATADLQDARRAYESTGDVGVAHQMLQERFEAFLLNVLEAHDDLVAEIVRRGWGLAGIREGDTILATKIPKSGFLVEYMNETDPEIRRQHYCHCPRVRDALKTSEALSATYCYCGAGYYKGIWEEILQRPVDVTVVESVLQGGDVCSIRIHLPPEALGQAGEY
jgi:hypothetical protein